MKKTIQFEIQKVKPDIPKIIEIKCSKNKNTKIP